MIDFYGPGPYLDIDLLLLGSIQEIGQYMSSVLIFSAYIWAAKRFLPSSLKRIAMFIPPVFQICYVYSVSIKREFIFSLSFAILITLQLRILQLLPFHAEDYVLMFCLLLFPNRLFNNTSAIVGNIWIFIILFLSLYTAAKISMRHIKGNHFSCYFLFIVLSFFSYAFQLACISVPLVFKSGREVSLLMITIILAMLIH